MDPDDVAQSAARGSSPTRPTPGSDGIAERERSPSAPLDTFDTSPHAKALKALLERPGFSLRARLSLSFLFFFLLSAGIAISALVTLNWLERRLQFLYVADQLTNEIQQARRHEKNHFLYGTNLENVRVHLDRAQRISDQSRKELRSVVGAQDVATMEEHLEKYRNLISSLDMLEQLGQADTKAKIAEIEQELRTHGAEMLDFASDVARKERKSVERVMQLANWVPVGFLVILLAVMIYGTSFFTRHIIGRLNRLMEATQQISTGDFRPIMPTRRFRDEFTNLAVALNSMMHQLGERQEILVQSHKLRAVGTLTAGVAHELNNPINNIVLTAEGLKEDYADLSSEETLEMINDLVEQAERAQHIVRNLLDFARKEEIVSESLDIGELLRRMLDLSNNQIKLHNVKLYADIPTHLPHVFGDRQQLTQVFLNLVLNALDAMPEGGVLRVEASHADDPGFLAIQVIDTGKGIPEDIMSSIFDPFFTTKSTGAGTGLGLSVSQGIIRKHGGDIQVTSIANEDPDVPSGTTFTVLLPISSRPAPM